MNANQKLKEGQRVRMTPEAIATGLHGFKVNRRTGVVTEFVNYAPVGNATELVRVRRDGERVAKTYHMDFWEPDE